MYFTHIVGDYSWESTSDNEDYSALMARSTLQTFKTARDTAWMRLSGTLYRVSATMSSKSKFLYNLIKSRKRAFKLGTCICLSPSRSIALYDKSIPSRPNTNVSARDTSERLYPLHILFCVFWKVLKWSHRSNIFVPPRQTFVYNFDFIENVRIAGKGCNRLSFRSLICYTYFYCLKSRQNV